MDLKQLLAAGLLTVAGSMSVCAARPPGSGSSAPMGHPVSMMPSAARPPSSYRPSAPARSFSNQLRAPSSAYRAPAAGYRTPYSEVRRGTGPFNSNRFGYRNGYGGDPDHHRRHDRDGVSVFGFYPLPFYGPGAFYDNGFYDNGFDSWDTGNGYAQNYGPSEYANDPGPYGPAESPYPQAGPEDGNAGPGPAQQYESPRDLPVPYAPAGSGGKTDAPAPPMPPITVVLRNGQRFTSQNYAVMDGTLWDFSHPVARKIPVASIDAAASVRATEQAGGEWPALNGESGQNPTN